MQCLENFPTECNNILYINNKEFKSQVGIIKDCYLKG